MAFGNAMASDKFDDNTLDNPQEAFTQLKANADVYNAFRLLMKACAGLDIGDGLKDDLAGNLVIALASDAGLEIVTNLLKVKLQADSGLERVAAGLKVDINSLTTAAPDTAADFLMWWDATDSKLKKALMSAIAPVTGPNSITQTEIATAAVGQAELKTANGDVSVSTTEGTTQANLTLPGGAYGFWPRLRNTSNAGDVPKLAQILDNSVVPQSVTTSNVARIVLQTQGGGSGATLFANQQYIQASPPYDLGNGEVAGFIFALIDNATGDPIAMYQAPEPPWALNGPTDIRPELIDKNGKKFKLVEQGRERLSAIIGNAGKQAALLNTSRNRVKGEMVPVEITNAMKNADMGLIPHPFIGNDMTGKTVVLLDPMSGFVERMMEFQQDGDSPLSEIFHKGFAKIDNVKLPRKGPLGVDIVAAKLK